MRRYSVYIYPNISRELMGANNPYIENLKKALGQNELEVDPATTGNAFMDFIRKGISSDMVILNWLENLPSRRMGVLQSFIILAYILLLKICRVKIVWIKHNKISHTKKWFAISKRIHKVLSRHADYIIIHGLDAGITSPASTLFLPHPSNIRPGDILRPVQNAKPAIDLLIWGSLLPYKGVLEFLQYVKKDPALQELTIHIAGKSEEDYARQLMEYTGPRITFVNEYVKEEELKTLFERARFILFTYNKRSVISSGILMDSLVACKRIIAPDCGAFRDMAEQQQFASLYDDFSDIASLCRQNYDNFQLDYNDVQKFVAQNSWYNMGNQIKGLLGPKTRVQSPNHIEIPQTP